MSAINQGRPLSEVEPRAEITNSFKDLASLVTGRNVKKSILPWK
jgi:Flp pilus assembly CpaE family ATPase